MKHLVDLDEAALEAAKRRLGTTTMKDTVNTALRLAAGDAKEVDTLAAFDFIDREQAWR